MLRYPVSDPALGPEEAAIVAHVVRSGFITMGEVVASFEASFAERLGVRHAVATSTGTAALQVAILSMGLRPGDRVLVPDLTFFATASVVRHCGAEPVYMDVDATWGMDPDAIERTDLTGVVGMIPVHLYGSPCRMVALMEIARRRGLWVVEDAAEGLGGCYAQQPLGTLADAAAFSFYGNKVLTCGEGGAVVTNDDVIATRARAYRNQGQTGVRYRHDLLGFNYRMTDLHAAIGCAQLAKLNASLARRTEVMAHYMERLGSVLETPDVSYGVQAPWLFTGVLPVGVDRAMFMQHLDMQGIETRPVFMPLHDQPCLDVAHKDFPNANRIGYRGVSLPTHPKLTLRDVDAISDIVLETLQEMGR